VRLGPVEVERRVGVLARSVAEIESAIRRAEGRIEADARERIHALRDDTKARLAVLHGQQQEASRLLRALSSAPPDSRDDRARAASTKLAEACAVVHALLERLRSSPTHGADRRRRSRASDRDIHPRVDRLPCS
jgi:hypothetical protein